jgi:hypothetical protein
MVEASVKFSFTQGFEPGMPAQVSSVITTTPLKVTRKGMKIFNYFCLIASRWGLGSNLLGSPPNIAIKK